ncbi:ribosome biogenesis protein NOP53 [Sitophilus oryzae]|uniref:Ribosome biogenesis protein NOP53 n=1 Tax=Sitophilus oryzae TaxID=7048 RepID=A0A6J2XV53_SITOR|nr:ribosome biogenesis protein NOP53 [Sitophilus oryzae]
MAISGTKRKRVSKKSKLSWRKHTKVKDIETFLDDQREEERLGAPLEVLTNEQLFVLDTKPQTELLTLREKRRLRATRPLKGFAALQPHTGVPDPIKKRNRVKTKEERQKKLIKKEDKNRKAKEIDAVSQRRLSEIRRENERNKRGNFSLDLWGDTISLSSESTIQKKAKEAPKDLHKKRSVLPAVELPHPGMSYNPSFKDHQELLQIIVQEESKVIKKEKHLARVTKDIFRKVSQDKQQKEWMSEMSQGLDLNQNMKSKSTIKKEENYDRKAIKQEKHSARRVTKDAQHNEWLTETAQGLNINEKIKEEENEDDLDRISINPPTKNKKKTLQQRRKQREQLELEKQRASLKREKKKIGDIHKIKVLKQNLEKIENKQKKLRELRKVRLDKKKLEPKVLSSSKIDDPGFDFQMGEKISGNLRSLQKEGNILSDRFVSLQKRNILEPSKRAHRKRPKIKKYVKPGHKDDWEVTIARENKLLSKK